jgi:hypothetical protein
MMRASERIRPSHDNVVSRSQNTARKSQQNSAEIVAPDQIQTVIRNSHAPRIAHTADITPSEAKHYAAGGHFPHARRCVEMLEHVESLRLSLPRLRRAGNLS